MESIGKRTNRFLRQRRRRGLRINQKNGTYCFENPFKDLDFNLPSYTREKESMYEQLQKDESTSTAGLCRSKKIPANAETEKKQTAKIRGQGDELKRNKKVKRKKCKSARTS
ncbi:unnamed protein product [Phyllotreta striolata]|uniref:Uncharacterized protein n=1 Tax=Phyllotreta striolata TaxID=444603 RepID=A0A9N9TNM1_PHYSR|nr:unnamed protein product [Phyllotreta striolata]